MYCTNITISTYYAGTTMATGVLKSQCRADDTPRINNTSQCFDSGQVSQRLRDLRKNAADKKIACQNEN